MRALLIACMLLPAVVWAQAKTWQIESIVGFNLSVNQMQTIRGEPSNMSNTIRPGGMWSLLAKYQINEHFTLLGGIDHVAYKYHYRYGLERGNGGASKSTVYLWGFPFGLENHWINSRVSFATGYGLKFRYNGLGSPFNLESSSQIYNLEEELVFNQSLKEFDVKQQVYFLALFMYAKLSFKVKPRFNLAIILNYNQGLQKHESFSFLAINNYPLDQLTRVDEYQYYSRASYPSASLGFTYIIQKKEVNLIHSPNPQTVTLD